MVIAETAGFLLERLFRLSEDGGMEDQSTRDARNKTNAGSLEPQKSFLTFGTTGETSIRFETETETDQKCPLQHLA